MDKTETSTWASREEMSGFKKEKSTEGKTLRFREECCRDVAFPSLHKFNNNALYTLPTGSSSRPQSVANPDNEWLEDIRKDFNLCPDGTIDRYEAVSPFPQSIIMLEGISPTYS